jgi:hypothetical protein
MTEPELFVEYHLRCENAMQLPLAAQNQQLLEELAMQMMKRQQHFGAARNVVRDDSTIGATAECGPPAIGRCDPKDRSRRLERILLTYDARDRSIGVLMFGLGATTATSRPAVSQSRADLLWPFGHRHSQDDR